MFWLYAIVPKVVISHSALNRFLDNPKYAEPVQKLAQAIESNIPVVSSIFPPLAPSPPQTEIHNHNNFDDVDSGSRIEECLSG